MARKMADLSTKGFIIALLPVLILLYPVPWFSTLLTVLLFGAVGWTIIGIAREIEELNLEIQELRREIKSAKKKGE